jgi:Flp pilus assembly protein TadB
MPAPLLTLPSTAHACPLHCSHTISAVHHACSYASQCVTACANAAAAATTAAATTAAIAQEAQAAKRQRMLQQAATAANAAAAAANRSTRSLDHGDHASIRFLAAAKPVAEKEQQLQAVTVSAVTASGVTVSGVSTVLVPAAPVCGLNALNTLYSDLEPAAVRSNCFC